MKMFLFYFRGMVSQLNPGGFCVVDGSLCVVVLLVIQTVDVVGCVVEVD